MQKLLEKDRAIELLLSKLNLQNKIQVDSEGHGSSVPWEPTTLHQSLNVPLRSYGDRLVSL